MSGHSKWAQIKRQKASTDAKKSKVFAMLVKTIAVEVKRAGGDRNSPGVRAAAERARAANMPNENIERAIKNAQGQGGAVLEEVLYEAYGPGGAALLIEGITDNKNRTSQEIRHLLDANGGNLTGPGAATWAFKKINNEWQPKVLAELSETDAQALANLIDTLTEHEDVKKISDNAGLGD